MPSCWPTKSRPSTDKYSKLDKQAKKHAEKRPRGIYKLEEIKEQEMMNSGQVQVANPSGPSPHNIISSQKNTTSPNHNSHPNNVPRSKLVITELEEGLPRFGPVHGKDTNAIKNFKKAAWDHIVSHSNSEEKEDVLEIYTLAISDSLKAARGTYAPVVEKDLEKDQFRRMMIIDGCFFLQLALYIIGGSELLGYTEKHVYFGEDLEDREKKIRRWIKAMFFVGNQVPNIILRQLIKQSFFKDIIAKGKEKGIWVLPSDDPPKLLLYLLVVSPEPGESSIWEKIMDIITRKKEAPYLQEKPTDLLHAFHCLVLGPAPYNLMHCDSDDDEDDGIDLEEGKVDDEDKEKRFPSATELQQSGIKLKKAQGIREIHFDKCFFFSGRLYMPPFTFERNTESMLRYLTNYELAQKLGNNEREGAEYLRFMRDLVRTGKDVKILRAQGILIDRRSNSEEKLPRMLRKLCPSDDNAFAQNLRLTRIKVKEYRSLPRQLFSLMAFLTVVQTIFTILAYAKPLG